MELGLKIIVLSKEMSRGENLYEASQITYLLFVNPKLQKIQKGLNGRNFLFFCICNIFYTADNYMAINFIFRHRNTVLII